MSAQANTASVLPLSAAPAPIIEGAHLAFAAPLPRPGNPPGDRTVDASHDAQPFDFSAQSLPLDIEECSAAWNALLDGTCAVVRTVDHDGFRILLTESQGQGQGQGPRRKPSAVVKRRILRQLLAGVSKKFIAVDLLLPPSTVDFHLKNALTELGFNSRGEMLRILGAPRGATRADPSIVSTSIQTPPDMQGWSCTLDGRLVVVLAYSLPNLPSFPQLTKAEAELAGQLLLGASNREIAQRRGTSRFTVANQIASIFRKLEVHSRAELAGWAGRSREREKRSSA